MKSIPAYLISICLLYILESCERYPCKGLDLSDEVNIYDIPNSNKLKIPYTGNDTLVFVSDVGDTAKLIGQGKNLYYTETRNGSYNADCPKTTIYKYENLDINFRGDSSSKFQNLFFKSMRLDWESTTYISVRINSQNSSIYTFETFQNILPEDSILMNNKYISGYFIDNNKSILYNYKNGIFKLKDSNGLIWKKVI